MRNRFDQFAKGLLSALLGSYGVVRTQEETLADAQAIDVTFAPSRAVGAETSNRFVQRLAASRSLIEAFHNTPSLEVIRSCRRKQLNWAHSLNDAAEHFPWLWVVATGEPRAAMRGYRMVSTDGMPSGTYTSLADALRLSLIVTSQLPRTRETLLLRLLGRGRTLSEAIDDLLALPDDAWERQRALGLLVRMRFEVDKIAANKRDAWDQEVLMRTELTFDEFVEQTRQEGREEGREEGERLILTRLVRLRFGPELADRVAAITDASLIDQVTSVFADADGPEEFAAQLDRLPGPA